MRQVIIKDIIQSMLPYLNKTQNEKLQEVLNCILINYDVVENKQREKTMEQNFVELF